MDDHQHPLYWVGSSKNDLKAMPADVQDLVGYALHLAQLGTKHFLAKPLKGFIGAGVLEIAMDYAGDTYRAVYTVAIGNAVYVLHCFKKKSKHGIQTARRDINLISKRLKSALAHAVELHHGKN